MGGISDALAWLGLKERSPRVDPSGLVVWDRMDEAFRTVCAVWADGRCLIAEGYGADAHVREILSALRATGAAPARLREQIVPLERIAAAWGRGEGLLELADPRTVERVHDAFAKAVEAEGDDVAIEVGTEDTRVKVVVHDRKLQIGKPLSVRDGELMIEHLMYGRDEGSGQTGTIRQSFQGFSLGAGEVKLPERIAALRCERGPHAPGDGRQQCHRDRRDLPVLAECRDRIYPDPECGELLGMLRGSAERVALRALPGRGFTP